MVITADLPSLIQQARANEQRLDSPDFHQAWQKLRALTPALLQTAKRNEGSEPTKATEAVAALSPVLCRLLDGRSMEHHLLRALSLTDSLPPFNAIVELHCTLIRGALLQGDFHRAKRFLAAARLKVEGSPELDLYDLHLNIRTGFLSTAEAQLKTLLNTRGKSRALEMQSILLNQKLGNLGRARVDLEGLLSLCRAEEARYTLGALSFFYAELELHAQRWENALERIEAAHAYLSPLGLQTQTVVLMVWQARALHMMGRAQAATSLSQRAFEASQNLGAGELMFEAAFECWTCAQKRGERTREARWKQELSNWRPFIARPEMLHRAQVALESPSIDPTKAQVSEDGRWFEISGKKVDLSRRSAAKRILRALAQSRLQTPNEVLSAEILFSAGWPDQKIHPESATKRVYTAIWQLRRAGLGPHLQQAGEGYKLAEPVHIVA